MTYFEDKVADTEKEVEKLFHEMIKTDMDKIHKIADTVKEDYMLLECMNCDNFYTCDNNWEDNKNTVFIDCTMKRLLNAFKKQLEKEMINYG